MGTTACGGKGSKGRAVSGDWPIGAARCRPKHTEVSYQTPPPMGAPGFHFGGGGGGAIEPPKTGGAGFRKRPKLRTVRKYRLVCSLDSVIRDSKRLIDS